MKLFADSAPMHDWVCLRVNLIQAILILKTSISVSLLLMHSERKSFRCGVFYIDPNEPAPEEGTMNVYSK